MPDITVETIVGMLPRLPATVPAAYRDGKTGPDVRVIWPSPTDTKQVAAPGSYTVTGRVPGTSFAPKATVIVKVPVGIMTPPSRLAEPFPLSQVVLEPDTKGRPTPFIRNRDKFIRGLAASNPDNFLYNFRDAFGQPQPAGAQQLEGWDNQTTRLRGHASGHYLSAIAQAYASTTYDKELRANFLQKMNYLIDTLYDLSQKSGKPATAGGPVGRRSDRGSAGTRPERLRLEPARRRDPHRLLELGRRVHQRVSARPVHHAREGRDLRHAGLADLGAVLHAAQDPRRACSTATKSAATRRRSRSRRAWAPGRTRG